MTTLAINAERLREERAELQPLVSMFSSQGWKTLATLIEDDRSRTRSSLLVPGRIDDIGVIRALQERYAVLTWLMDLVDDKTAELKRKTEELNELEQREGT